MRKKNLIRICAAVIMTVALVIPAAAASTADQMAANSAAWWVAYNAGDTATCNALHAANVALANQASSGGGSASYNSSAGTWNVTTSSGSNISSSGSVNNKNNNITYTTTTSGGNVSSTSVNSYSTPSINAYMGAGGTNAGLETSYNNAAANVSGSGAYGNNVATTTASSEAAVAKQLLGLTDAQAQQLERDLNASKQQYESASAAYEAAKAAGDTAAAERAQAQMDAAHQAAQDTRAEYGYTGDQNNYEDGGYYDATGKPASGNGGGFFFMSDVKQTFKITANCNDGGTISPSGTVNVKKGDSQTFAITPNEGYRIKAVKVDGADQGAISTYTFSNVSAEHTINAEFTKKTNDITASCGAGGSISPNGTTSVAFGENKTFTITPDWGYVIDKVMVDGMNKGTVASYTFTNVKETHTITASFKADGTISAGTPVVKDTVGSSLTGTGIKSGYGVCITVPYTSNGVKDIQATMTYNFGDGTKSIGMVQSGSSFVLPVNPTSSIGARCVYIPVATADGSYTMTVTVTAKNAAGETITSTTSTTITVLGNMYEDDFTGDS